MRGLTHRNPATKRRAVDRKTRDGTEKATTAEEGTSPSSPSLNYVHKADDTTDQRRQSSTDSFNEEGKKKKTEVVRCVTGGVDEYRIEREEGGRNKKESDFSPFPLSWP